jgi:class 3 adenylate cyclase/tetratricopeptide (TPR) repeat protein
VTELPTGTVTLLFTDIEGSTRLLARLRDRYGELLAEHERILRSAFEEYGGRVVDTQGDSLFAVFPRARDAVAAAAATQRALAAQRWPEGAEVRVRMGIHTGEPSIGGERYVGLGVHRAARISSAGHGGQVLLSNATRELVEDELPRGVRLRDLGEHQLKDLDRPDRVFQLVIDGLRDEFPPLKATDRAVESAERGDGRRGSTFVGRDRELRQLVDVLDTAITGRGRLVLIGGEPGIGKSHLADEVARHARMRRARVLWGRCWEAGGAPAYWPWVQAIRAYMRDTETSALRDEMGKGVSDIAQMLPELRDLFPDVAPPASGDPEGARFRLFDSTASFLRKASNAQPLLLVLDDMHAADTPSLLLLEFIARELGTARVLAVATYRDIEVTPDHPLARTLAELGRQPTTHNVSLGGLTRAEVARLIELTADLEPPDAVVSAVHAETEGNPLFVGEVVRLLASEGRLADPADAESLRFTIPDSVREVIGRRIQHLSSECKRVLTVASVVGREFGLDALEYATEISGDDLLDILDEAIAARVVSEAPGSRGRLRFSHALIRDALYDELTTPRRIRHHRRVAEALERLHRDEPGPHLAELAHHFFEAAPGGDVGNAIDYARRAAEHALALLAFEEAARLYRMALRALELRQPVEERSGHDLLVALGEAQARAGESSAAKQAFLEAADIARRVGDAETLARAALGYGGRFVWEASRDDPHLVPLLEAALAALPDADSPLRARLLARLAAGPLRDAVDREPRCALVREAVANARRLNDPATLAYVLDGFVAATWGPDNPEERVAVSTEMIEAAGRAGDKERMLQAHHWRALALLELGDVPAVHAELAAKTRLAEELRQPTQYWYLFSLQATVATFEGRYAEAENLIEQAFKIGHRAQGYIARVCRGVQLWQLRRDQGRLDEVVSEIARLAEDFPSYIVVRCVLAETYAELGREDAARRIVHEVAPNRFTALPVNDEWLFGMALLADAAARVADDEHVRQLYELLTPYAHRNAVSAPDGSLGSVSRNLGVLAARVRNWADAERHFEDALEMNVRMGARPWVAHTQLGYARMVLRRAEAGDRDRAALLLDDAIATYDTLGMTGFGERAESLRRSLIAPARR